MFAKARCSLALIALATSVAAHAEASSADIPTKPRLTIDRLYALPSLIGTAPSDFAWSADGRHLAFLWNDKGFKYRDVWMIDTQDPDLRPVRVTSMSQEPQPDAADFADPLALAQEQEKWERDSGVTSVAWHPSGRQMLASWRGDLWLVQQDVPPLQVTETSAPETQAAFSADGSSLAFFRDGELWLMATDPGISASEWHSSTVQMTKISEKDRRISGFSWSPDGSRIAILETDQHLVALRGIPDYLAKETALTEVRRAYPGEEPVRQRLGILAADATEANASQVRWIDWGQNEPDMLLSYRFSPDGQWLAIDTSDLYAKDRQIFVLEVTDQNFLTPRQIAQDQDPHNETFYYWRIEWSTDSRLLYFLSDRDEDYHVYAVDPLGQQQPKRLTQGAWAVAEMFAIDGGLIVVGNRGLPEERHFFHVGNDGGEPRRISQRPGTHAPTVSPDGRWAAVQFSSQSVPPELLLTALEAMAGTDKRERRVTHSPLPEFEDFRWVEAEFVTFPSHIDGTTLHGRVSLPLDFDPRKTYPAIVGSVYTDSVRNQWGWRTAHPTWGLDQYLLQEGYVVFNLDMRGSWGRGREHRRGIRLDYGGMDIEDLESGVRYLATLGYIDMDRVGIWGSSYGGLMTAMSMFRKPGLYAAGIAGAPATNVRHALTGQMAVMMRPQDQPDEYTDSSPVEHAAGLEDPLMIVHGMRDWVVLFKDSVILTQRLILLGKDVELVALPNAGHGWDNEGLAQTRFAFHKMVRFFDRHLKSPCRDCREEHHETE